MSIFGNASGYGTEAQEFTPHATLFPLQETLVPAVQVQLTVHAPHAGVGSDDTLLPPHDPTLTPH